MQEIMVILDSFRISIVPTVPNTSRLVRYSAVIMRWCLITFVVFTTTLWTGKYIYENVLTRTYTATAEIETTLTAFEVHGSATPAGEPQPTVQDLAIEQIVSPDILVPVIRELMLGKAWAKRVYKSDADALSDSEALGHLVRILKIDYVRGTNVLRIIVSSDDPKEASDIANAIADRYTAVRDDGGKQRSLRPAGSQQSPVRIISRATMPEYPSSPNKPFCFMVTVGVAVLISVVAGCFVEVIMLFVRAAEGDHS